MNSGRGAVRLAHLTGGQGVAGSNPGAPTTLGAVNSKSKGAYGSVLFLDDPNQLVLIGMVWYHFWALFGHPSKDVARPLIHPSYRNRAYTVNSIKYIGSSSAVGDKEAER